MRKECMDTVYHYIGGAESALTDAVMLANNGEFTSAKAIVESINGLTNAVLALVTLELESQLQDTEIVVVNRG